MKTVRIEDVKSCEITRYYIDGIRLSRDAFYVRLNTFRYFHQGSYSHSYTEKTKNGNWRHVAYYSH